MITIDQLRRIKYKPSYMGLGVIKLRIDERRAYRFYCDEVAKQTVDQCHTHTFSFESKILKGVLRNITYDVSPVDYETDYRLTQGRCSQVTPPETTAENVTMTETFRIDSPVGTEFTIDSQTFHRIELVTDKVITLKQTTHDPDICPQFVEDKRIGYVNPWEKDILKTPEQCWEAINYILTN